MNTRTAKLLSSLAACAANLGTLMRDPKRSAWLVACSASIVVAFGNRLIQSIETTEEFTTPMDPQQAIVLCDFVKSLTRFCSTIEDVNVPEAFKREALDRLQQDSHALQFILASAAAPPACRDQFEFFTTHA